jgi:hypothetical protein
MRPPIDGDYGSAAAVLWLIRIGLVAFLLRILWLSVTDLTRVGEEEQGRAIWSIARLMLLSLCCWYVLEVST